MALRIALELDVYKTLSSDNGSPKSAAQLAEPKGADPVLVGESSFLETISRFPGIYLWILLLNSQGDAPLVRHVQ